MSDLCKYCVHDRICQLWRDAEMQDASCYVNDCFEKKAEADIYIAEVEDKGNA